MAVKGAVLGDILGAQYEFERPKNLDWKNVPLDRGHHMTVTDDSVMLLAIKQAYTDGTDLTETMVKIGRKYPNAGYGGRFYNWINGDDHSPYNSWGNGSAMRVAFVGEFFEDYDEMQRRAAETAAVSHDHPEGIKGAVVTATCIWMAKHGMSRQDIYDYVLEQYPAGEYPFSIDKDMDYLRKHYIWTEKCSDTVPAAMRCFYDSRDYESFMRNIFSFECDSDTFGAIAGGVAEEYYHGFGNVDAEGILKKYVPEDLYEILVR
ncbi:MAG: ADP-ribosylglycohydrolase family protein [Parasporobacterium sp.]|nr:ADP-ribosylglycohydrolase family protein [Parasporobacterium sp.]